MSSPNNLLKIKRENFLKKYQELVDETGMQFIPTLQSVPFSINMGDRQGALWGTQVVMAIEPKPSQIVKLGKKVSPPIEIKK